MKRKRMLAALFGAIALSLLWGGATMAHLLGSAMPIVNVFDAPEYTLELTEDFDGTVKENVCITLGGDVAQYVRVQILPTLQDEQGNTLACAISLDDFIIEGFDESAWVCEGAYYYYITPVQPGEEIIVFTSARVQTSFAEGQIPTLIITAQGIQTSAAQSVWGVSLADGQITGGGSST